MVRGAFADWPGFNVGVVSSSSTPATPQGATSGQQEATATPPTMYSGQYLSQSAT